MAMSKRDLSRLLKRAIGSSPPAHFERVLGLKFGTVRGWRKTGRVSAVDAALLRIVATYPWMLDVAEENFSPVWVDRMVMAAVFDAAERAQATLAASRAWMIALQRSIRIATSYP